MSKITDEMLDAGLKAYYGVDPSSIFSDTKRDCSSDMARAYLAMRAARPRKQRKAEQDAPQKKPVVNREAVARAMRCGLQEAVGRLVEIGDISDDGWSAAADAAIAAMLAAGMEEAR